MTTDGTDVTLLDAGKLKIGTGGDLVISSSNDQVYFGLNTNNKDLIFMSNETTILRLDESHNSVIVGSGSTGETVAMLLVHAGQSGDKDGIRILQEDSTERALWIDSEGAGIYMTAKDGLEISVDEDDGFGINTYRNKAAAATGAPLVRIRDQDGDQHALRVLAESTHPDAFAVAIGNGASVKTTISGSGQVGIGMGTDVYTSMLHVKGISRGDGIVLEDADSTDTVVKIYESTDDGVIDVYANNTVTSRIHGNGTSFIGGALNITGSVLPGDDISYNLGSESKRWANIYTGDLHLRNDRGDWTIIEEREYLSVRNNHTGKIYKMVLEPVSEE